VKLRKRQRILLIVATTLLVLAIVALAHHLKARRALANYQAQLIAVGEKLTVEEMTPKPVVKEPNGVNSFYRALSLMNVPQGVFRTNAPNAMTMVAPGKARVAWAQPQIWSRDATNEWEDAIANASDLSPALIALEELIERPQLDFGVNYRLGFSAPLPNLAPSKQAAQALCHAALCDLHRGDAASATKRLRALLAISRGTTDECLVISQLVRIAITAIGSGATWELLQSTNVTDAQLAQLQSDWSRLEFSLAAENAVAMERAMSLMTAEQMRESSAEFRKMTTAFAWPAAAPAAPANGWFDQAEQFAKDTWDQGRLKAKETAWRYSWAYTDQLRTLRGLQALIESIRYARANGNYAASFKDLELEMTALGFHDLKPADEPVWNPGADVDIRTMFSKSILSLTPFFRRLMVVEANRQLTVTAIALQRYKLAHGNYPRELAALVPDLLSSLPRDPADGKALRYQSNADGTFLLYSVGEDGEDNGGDINPAKPERSMSLQWQQRRDWVWPHPATAQEIADFYQRGSK
jgi:hypothetical protein